MTRKIGIVCCSDGFNRAYEGEIEELHRILADMGIESVISHFCMRVMVWRVERQKTCEGSNGFLLG